MSSDFASGIVGAEHAPSQRCQPVERAHELDPAQRGVVGLDLEGQHGELDVGRIRRPGDLDVADRQLDPDQRADLRSAALEDERHEPDASRIGLAPRAGSARR